MAFKKSFAALGFLALAAVLFVVGSHSAKAVSTSPLIKGSGSAVYYLAYDGKRHAFPSDRVYFSWYTDFSGVQTISDEQLASYPLGSNVTYHPGRMIKITSDDKVYAVDPGARLRWVETEEVANAIFGADWNKKVDDIDVANFSDYTIDAPVTFPEDYDLQAALAVATINDELLAKAAAHPAGIGDTPNLVPDSGFETNASGFYKQYSNDSVVRTTTGPIAGVGSLKISLSGNNHSAWWTKNVSGTSYGFASKLVVSGKLRGDTVNANSKVRYCATAYYVGSVSLVQNCTDASQVAGAVTPVTTTLALDATKKLSSVRIRVTVIGANPVVYTLDDASAILTLGAGSTSCTADIWSCGAWNACSTTGSQTRTCNMTTDCASVVTPSPATTQSCTPTSTTGPTSPNLITDAGFETSVDGFYVQNSTDSVTRNTTTPISGTGSLSVAINGYGNNIWVTTHPAGTTYAMASSMTVTGKIRGDVVRNDTTLQVCAAVYYADGSGLQQNCANASQVAGQVNTITANLPLDSTKAIGDADVRVTMNGPGPVRYSLDDFSAVLALPGTSTGGGGGTTCTADVWTCGTYSACTTGGTQTRTCTMTTDCAGVVTPSPATSQACTPPTSCTADTWTCTAFNACSTSGTQSRTCTMTNDCAGVVTPSPAISQSCTPTTCTADTWTCTAFSTCTNSSQTRTCTMTNDCAGVTTPSPATSQSCSTATQPTAGFTAILTDDGTSTPLPYITDAQDPSEPNMTPALNVSVPNAQCNKVLGFVNPAVAIPTTSRIREVEGFWNGTALPVINPTATEFVEEAHGYGSQVGFFKPVFSLTSIPAGQGTLEIRAFDSSHAPVTTVSIPNLNNYKPPTPLSAGQIGAIAHPRIYLTPSRLAAIKAKSATDPTFQRFWSTTGGVGYFLGYYSLTTDPETTAFSNNVYNPESYIPTLALCYQLKKDSDPTTANKCADAAYKMVMRETNDYLSGARSYLRDSGYDIRWSQRDLMLAYDWMYDKFTPAERANIAKVGVAFVDAYKNGPGYAATLPVENYYAGFLQGITLAGISTAGDSPDADRMLTLLRTKLTNEMPVLNQRACGGDWAEGWNYGPYTLLEYALANQTLKDVGEDWSPVFDFVQPLARSLTYQITSDNLMTVSSGDYSGDYAHLTRPWLLAVLSGTTTDAALASRLYSAMLANPSSDIHVPLDRGNTFYEMIFGDTTKTPNLAGMPLSYLNAGDGRYFSKSSLTDSAAYEVTADNVSYDGDHYGFAGGEVQLYHGSTCLLCSGAYRGPNFNGLAVTKDFSTYIVNGTVQTGVNRNTQMIMNKDTGAYAVLGMRYESAYPMSRYDQGMMTPSMPLDYLIRQVVHVRPGILVVRDLHRRRHSTDTMVGNWHLGPSGTVTTLSSGQYKVGSVNVSVFGQTPTFSTDKDAGGNTIGTLMTQTFPSSTAQTETVAVFSDVASGVSYSGGVLKLSNSQCVNFSNGDVTVTSC